MCQSDLQQVLRSHQWRVVVKAKRNDACCVSLQAFHFSARYARLFIFDSFVIASTYYFPAGLECSFALTESSPMITHTIAHSSQS